LSYSQHIEPRKLASSDISPEESNPGIIDPAKIRLREPALEDGMSVYRLIQRCPPLDTNSSYCNLLQCGRFSRTSVVAVHSDEIVGFISGFRLHEQPDVLFIWQVAVDEKARGGGLAMRMLLSILSRPHCERVRYIETTITSDNVPSWSLFSGLARKLSTDIQSCDWLDKQAHFDGLHESESLVRIGPFNHEQIGSKS
jgi:L-2,4-diaminobutyric acid acetyltransferase